MKKLEYVEMVNERYGLIHGGTIGKMYKQERRVYRTNGIAPAVLTSGGATVKSRFWKKPIPINTMDDGTARTIKHQYYKNGRANFKYQNTWGATGVMKELRIRKLTPYECWRLMDFDDEDIDKCIAIGMSNTQLYKQAWNSIVVAVLEKVLKNLLIGSEEETEEPTLLDYLKELEEGKG